MKRIIIILTAVLINANISAQNLSLKINENPISVLKINGNQLLQQVTLQNINNSYLFKHILKQKFNSTLGVDLIEDFGVDFQKDFFIVEEIKKDVFIRYFLYSLKDAKQFESVVSKDAKKIEKLNGIKYAQYHNNQRLAWNDSFVLFIQVEKENNYFNDYQYDFYDEFYKQDSLDFPEDYTLYPRKSYLDYEENDAVLEAVEAYESLENQESVEVAVETSKEDSAKYVQKLIEKDKLEKRKQAKRDRKKEYRKKKKEEFYIELDKDLKTQLDAKLMQVFKGTNIKQANISDFGFDNDAVASLYLNPSLYANNYFLFYGGHSGLLYRSFYASFYESLVFSENIKLNLFFNESNIELKSNMSFPDKLKSSFDKIYHTKMDKRFIKYIPEHALSYMSMSMNTEAYVEEYPNFIEYLVNKIDTSYSEEAKVFADLFNVFFDAEEIGELFTGDGVLIWNSLNYKKVEHTTYEYDETTFEYTTKVELRDQLMPEFTFMFGSKKEEIILKLFKLLVKHNLVKPYKNYYYFSHEDYRELPFNIYVAYQDEIVFITSDDQQINDIQNKQVADKLSKTQQKNIKKNPFSFYVNLEQIFNDIPLKDLDDEDRDYVMFGRNHLKEIISNGSYKNGSIISNTTFTIPQTEENATKYMLKLASEYLLIDDRH